MQLFSFAPIKELRPLFQFEVRISTVARAHKSKLDEKIEVALVGVKVLPDFGLKSFR